MLKNTQYKHKKTKSVFTQKYDFGNGFVCGTHLTTEGKLGYISLSKTMLVTDYTKIRKRMEADDSQGDTFQKEYQEKLEREREAREAANARTKRKYKL